MIVQDTAWLFSLDDIVRFRRFLRDKFSLPMREELKSSFLIHNTGPFEYLGLGDDIRKKIFKMALKLMPKLNEGRGVDVFSIIVDKDEMIKQGREGENAQEAAWERASERLERYTYYNRDTCVIYPDEGEFHTIRKLLRGKRLFFLNLTPSTLKLPSLILSIRTCLKSGDRGASSIMIFPII